MSTLKVDTIRPRSASTITFGASGDTIAAGSGVTISGFGTTISNDANNRITTADGSGGLNAEANLNFDGTNLDLGSTTSTSTATPLTIGIGGTYSNSAGNNPKLKIWEDATYYMGLGVSANKLEFINSRDIYDFVFYGGGSEIVRIEGTGNVGIGTTSPATKFDVNGNANVAGEMQISPGGTNYNSGASILGTSAGLEVYAQNTSSSAVIIGNSSGRAHTWLGYANGNNYITGDTTNSEGHPAIFRTFDGSSYVEHVRVNSAGNVGIGTSSPSASLHIQQSTPTLTLETSANSNDPLITLKSSGAITGEGAQIFYTNNIGNLTLTTTYPNNNASIDFRTATGTDRATNNLRMRITGDGDVGISTSSPQAQLHIYNFSGSGGLRVTRGNNLTSNGMRMITNSTTNFLESYGDLVLSCSAAGTGTGASERMRITSSGNIGIGLSSPTEKLHVSGNILATGDVTSNSDIRLKENIQPLNDSLNKVKQLTGKSFTMKDTGNKSIGLIAQEVESIIPEVVLTASDEQQTKSISYGKIVSVLIEAIKEQQIQIDELKRQVGDKNGV